MTKLKSLIILAATCCALTVNAADPAVQAVKPYVYPLNKAATPEQFTYLADGKSYAALSADGRSVIKYDIRTGDVIETMLDLSSTRETNLPSIEGFTLSEDGSKILVWRESKPVYRHSFTAEYYVYEIRTRLLRPVSANFKRVQSPLFSPDARMVAFVADNNIHIRKLDYQSEVDVTTDGSKNSIINGIPDWTYEEEFATSCSMAWAPDNLTLCYLKYNETDVPSYTMMSYEGTCDPQPQYSLYPGTWQYKYPVAGKPNSTVTLHSYDIDNRKTKDLVLPDNRIEYIPRITYGPSETALIVATLNRDQNHYEIYSVNPKSTIAKSIYTEDSRSWIDPVSYENLYLGKDYMVINSWKSGYNQLYQINYNGVELAQLTSGDYDVTDYYGADAEGNHYYQVAYPTPLDRVIRRLDKKGRVTSITPESGTSSATFSPGCSFFTLKYSSVTQPPVYTISSNAGKEIRVLLDNSDMKPKSAGREFFTMQSDGNTLNGFIVKPTGFDPSKKYPVIMYQYSGPSSQEVLNDWRIDWIDAFARQGYVIITVDGRGTGGRGRDFCDIVYQRLGYYETIDQIAAARYAAALPYVDPTRIGIFGWSYGGYETLMAITDSNSPYSAAVAVAPVTDWRYYDTVYTERYMRTPQENEDGYIKSAPIERAARVSCPLLLMYGTSDDNVHPANSIEMVSRLESHDILCDMLLFPNKNHSIYGCGARAVVYGKMLDWFNKNLK